MQPGETLQLRLDYRPDLFERADVEAHGPASDPAAGGRGGGRRPPLGRLPILGTAERDTILRGWNDTAQPVAPATLPALFAAQAARTPDAVAVVFEERTLSYAALDAHANRLAHHLQSLGVGPETMVGLCVERSPEMVVGLLGILKAGGAYLPLDPDYPPERLAFMLADAGCPVLVTQAALLDRLPADAARDRAASCGSTPTGRRSRGSPHTAPPLDARSAPSGLRDLHLGLDRHAQGRRGRAHDALSNFLGSMSRAGAARRRTTGCSP